MPDDVYGVQAAAQIAPSCTSDGGGGDCAYLGGALDDGIYFVMEASGPQTLSLTSTATETTAPVIAPASAQRGDPSSTQVDANPDSTLAITVALTGPSGTSVPPGDELTATTTSGYLAGAWTLNPTSGVMDDSEAGATGDSVVFPWAPGAQVIFHGTTAGPATITVTDDSAPTPVSASITVNVVPGAPYQVVDVGPNATSPYTVPAAGVYGPFYLTVEDAGGNPVADRAPISLSQINLAGVMNDAACDVVGVRAAADGSDLSVASIPAGSISTPVWLELGGNPQDTCTFGVAPTYEGTTGNEWRIKDPAPWSPTLSDTQLSQLDPVSSWTITPGATSLSLDGASMSILFTTPVAQPAPPGVPSAPTLSSPSLDVGSWGISGNGTYSGSASGGSFAWSEDGQSVTVTMPTGLTAGVGAPTTTYDVQANSLYDLAGSAIPAWAAPVTGAF